MLKFALIICGLVQTEANVVPNVYPGYVPPFLPFSHAPYISAIKGILEKTFG